MPFQRFGFIGLGAMGYLMAQNLRAKIDSSADLYIYDVNKESVQHFVQENSRYGPVHEASSAQEVAENSDLIITIVPEGKHVSAVYDTHAGGALAADVTGKIFIESSTIDLETSSKVAAATHAKGAIFIDAPVSGGTTGAEKGTITFMLGARDDQPHLEAIKAVLSTMGKNIFTCGGPTLGLATKICNNYISGNIAIATAEGMNLAIRLGLDPKVFSSVVAVSTGASWVNASCNPCPGVTPDAPASKGYAPGFKVQLMRKDYNLAVEAAKRVDARLLLGPVGLQTFTDASTDPRCVDRDCRVVYRFIGGREDLL